MAHDAHTDKLLFESFKKKLHKSQLKDEKMEKEQKILNQKMLID